MVEDFLGKIATCNTCGEQKRIVLQRNQVKGDQVDIYLECDDCVSVKPQP